LVIVIINSYFINPAMSTLIYAMLCLDVIHFLSSGWSSHRSIIIVIIIVCPSHIFGWQECKHENRA